MMERREKGSGGYGGYKEEKGGIGMEDIWKGM